LSALSAIRRRDAFARQVVDEEIQRSDLSSAQAAFARRLAFGVIAAEGTLDEALASHATLPPRLEPRVSDILRLGAYELLYARTPARAAVHEAVTATHAVRPQAAGLVNAILRRLAEHAAAFPWGDPDIDTAALARLTAHPLWLTQQLIDYLGRPAAAEMLAADQEPAPLYARLNPFRARAEECLQHLVEDGAEPAGTPPDDLAVVCRQAAAAVRGSAVASGRAVITDAAAQLAPVVLAPDPGAAVLEIASGRGTKTFGIQSVALSRGGPARVTSVDVHAFKADVLERRMTELRVPQVTARTLDATDAEELAALGSFDAALIDAPCSGIGSLRRHPDKRWRLDPGDPARLGELQRDLLRATASVVRPGGVMVYSTCTVTRAENEDVVSWFLSAADGAWVVEPIDSFVAGEWGRFITDDGCFRSWPRLGGPDGHFVARIRRVS